MPNRTSPRHPSFDYRTSAAYFVTICTLERRCLFGTVRQGRMYLNEIGQIVAAEWQRSEEMRDEVMLDTFVVMPTSTAGRFTKRSGVNHIHGIVCLVPPDVDTVTPHGYDLQVGPNPSPAEEPSSSGVGTHGDASLRERGKHSRWEEEKPQWHAQSLGSMVAGFKGAATKRINQHRDTPGAPVWQSRYHDRILRNEGEWRAYRRYVEQNPGRWHRDRNHPTRHHK